MGLASVCREDCEHLTNRKEKIKAKSTGCGCCSSELRGEEEIKEAAINSLIEIILAQKYFKWDLKKLIREAHRSEKIRIFKSK